MLSDEEKDNVFKISVPIITNEELERIDYTIENDLDNIVHQISETVSRDRDIIILKKVIKKQSKEIEELKDDRKKYAEEYIHNNPWLYKQLNENYILRVESEQKERKAWIKGTNDADELCNKKWENKIKAIIEELQEDIKYSANPLSIDNSKFGIKVLQSLLEKE